MELSNRQRQAIAILLGADRKVTLGAIADALDVSPRTVHRELSRLGPALETWGLRVKGRSGQGLQLFGEPERIRAFRATLGGVPDRSLTAADRRWMTVTLLLENPSSVKFFALEKDLGIGTSAVRAELDSLESWLEDFELTSVRRRGFGVAVEGSEYQKRLALVAALSERFSETDLLALFRDAGRRNESGLVEKFLFERFPRAVVARVDALVDRASHREAWDWAATAGLILTLHLVVALQRVAAGFVLDRVPVPDGDRGPARRLLENLTQAFGVDFPPPEVEWMTLHLEASKPNRAHASWFRTPAPDLVQGLRALISACALRMGFPFEQDSLLLEGLTAHWGPALARISHRLPIANALLPEIRQRFPEWIDAVTFALGEVFPRLSVPPEEVGYLVLHFASSVERSHRESVPFRALIVCSSGIGTSHMLASRIRAELPEIEVVANLSWSDVRDFSRDRYDLLISTVPLPLPDEDYVVVSPLLDESGLRTLRDHIRLRRLRLSSAPKTAKSVTTLSDLKSWIDSVGKLIFLVENLKIFDGATGDSWWATVADRLVKAGWLSQGEGFPHETLLPGFTGELQVLVSAEPSAPVASLSFHEIPTGGRAAVLLRPSEGYEIGANYLNVLVEGLSTPEVQAVAASGNESELRAVLARVMGRSLGPRPLQGD